MLDYFETDKARHEDQRDIFRSDRKPVDLEYVPETETVYKIIARAERASNRGQVYLSPNAKSDLDRCLECGLTCILVIDGVEREYKPELFHFRESDRVRSDRWLWVAGDLG